MTLKQKPISLAIAMLIVPALVYGCGTDRAPVFEGKFDGWAAAQLRPSISDAERDDFIEDCLIEAGAIAFARKQGGGFEGTNVGPEDEVAMSVCVDASFERWPNPAWPSTTEEFNVLYVLYRRQAECLEDQGIPVDVPSLDTYVDNNGFWVPYDDVPPPATRNEWQRLNTSCPQDPWHYERPSDH